MLLLAKTPHTSLKGCIPPPLCVMFEYRTIKRQLTTKKGCKICAFIGFFTGFLVFYIKISLLILKEILSKVVKKILEIDTLFGQYKFSYWSVWSVEQDKNKWTNKNIWEKSSNTRKSIYLVHIYRVILRHTTLAIESCVLLKHVDYIKTTFYCKIKFDLIHKLSPENYNVPWIP